MRAYGTALLVRVGPGYQAKDGVVRRHPENNCSV